MECLRLSVPVKGRLPQEQFSCRPCALRVLNVTGLHRRLARHRKIVEPEVVGESDSEVEGEAWRLEREDTSEEEEEEIDDEVRSHCCTGGTQRGPRVPQLEFDVIRLGALSEGRHLSHSWRQCDAGMWVTGHWGRPPHPAGWAISQPASSGHCTLRGTGRKKQERG